MHTRQLAAELLADHPDRAILILGGTYIYCQKSANNMLHEDAPTACTREDRWSNPC